MTANVPPPIDPWVGAKVSFGATVRARFHGLNGSIVPIADLPVLTPEPGGSAQCRGVVNDAVSIYFLDATLASAFVARWCAGAKDETDGGVYRMRDDEPKPRIGAAPHRIP